MVGEPPQPAGVGRVKAMPRLWTLGRVLRLSCLLAVGILQATAAIAAAVGAARLLSRPDTQDLTTALVILFGAVAVVALRVLQRRLAEQFALAYVKELRLALVSHVLRMPADGSGMRFGLVMTRVVNDFSAVRLWLASGLISILVAGCIVATIGAYLLVTQPGALAALAPALGLWLAVLITCSGPLKRRVADSRRLRGRIAATAGTVLKGRATYLAFGRHGPLIRKLGRQTDSMNRALTGRATLSGLLRSISDLVFPVTAIMLGFVLTGTTGTDMEALGVLILATGIIVAQLNAVAIAVEHRFAHLIATARLRNVFSRPTIDLSQGRSRLKRTGKGKRLEVTGLPIADTGRHLSFVADAGEQVALSGLRAEEIHAVFLRLAGLSDDHGGAVRLAGKAAARYSRRDWWRCICYVSQTLPPVPGVLADGVALGNAPDISDAERGRICARFNLTSDVLRRRLREDSHLTNGTAAAIRAARCVLRRASVVLVDDPDVLRNAELRSALLEELARQGATVVLAGEEEPDAAPPGVRVIRIDGSGRAAA